MTRQQSRIVCWRPVASIRYFSRCRLTMIRFRKLKLQEETSESEDENAIATESFNRKPDRNPQRSDARELFNAWNDPDSEGEPDELAGAEAGRKARLRSK